MSEETVGHHVLYVVVGVEDGRIVPPVKVRHGSVHCREYVPRCRGVVGYP